MTAELLKEDWFEGDDPGMNLFAVKTPKGEVIQNGDITSWNLRVIDLTGDPTVELTPDDNSSNASGTNLFTCTSSTVLTVDGYWTKNDIGYNIKHYVRNADMTTVPFKAGHHYRFVYRIQTGAFDGLSNRKCGQITLMREGTCRARGG